MCTKGLVKRREADLLRKTKIAFDGTHGNARKSAVLVWRLRKKIIIDVAGCAVDGIEADAQCIEDHPRIRSVIGNGNVNAKFARFIYTRTHLGIA